MLDGIGHVASLMDNKKIVIHEGCTELLRSIDQYRWDARPGLINEKPVHCSASHCADALRYLCYTFQENLPSF